MNDEYFTSELGLATVLLCKDFILRGMTHGEGSKNRKFFHFETPSVHDEIAGDVGDAYFSGQLLIEPMKFHTMQRLLKSKIYNAKQEPQTLA